MHAQCRALFYGDDDATTITPGAIVQHGRICTRQRKYLYRWHLQRYAGRLERRRALHNRGGVIWAYTWVLWLHGPVAREDGMLTVHKTIQTPGACTKVCAIRNHAPTIQS